MAATAALRRKEDLLTLSILERKLLPYLASNLENGSRSAVRLC